MRNIFSKTTAEKRTQNGVKTDSKRTNYGISILIFAFLTLGFGQAWAITFSGGYVYFDNTNTNWSNVIELVAHQYTDKDYIGATTMSKISGTNNLYYCSNPQGSNWGNIWGWRFMCNSSAWGNSENSDNNVKEYATNYTATTEYGLNSGSYYLCYGASSSKGCALTTSYLGNSNSYTSLNYTQTIYQCVAENGGTPAKSTASIGTISISTKYLYAATTASNHNVSITSGSNTCNTTAARTATVTMTATSIADGYTFLGWYDAETGGSQLESSTTYTYQATAEKTVYARFSHETTNSVNITYVCTETSATVSTATSQAIGQVTASSITAPTVPGYTFVNWTLGTGISNQSASTSANPINVKTLGTGTYTMRANYSEVLTSTYKLKGAFDSWGSGIAMSKKSGHSMEDWVYCTYSFTESGTTGLKIYDGSSTWFGAQNADNSLEKTIGSLVVSGWTLTSTNGGNNIYFKHYISGTYEFAYNTSTKEFKVTWPDVNQVYISAASPTDATNTNAFDLGTAVSNIRSKTLTLNANTTYTFKIVYGSDWYGKNSGALTRSTSTSSNTLTSLSTSDGNMTLTTDYAGSYTFKFNQSTKTLSVDFPEAYQITWDVGNVAGNKYAITCKKYGTNDAVISNSTWILKDNRVTFYAGNNEPENVVQTGYTWRGYYGDANGSTSQLSNQTGYSPTISTAGMSFYACFYENNYFITPYIVGQGSVSPADGQDGHIATPVSFTATPGTGYKFDSWEQRSGELTIESPTNATTNVNATAESYLQANFSPRWSVLGSDAFGGWSAYDAHLFDGYTVVSTKDVGYNTITLEANTTYEIKTYDRQTTTFYGGSSTQDIDYAASGAENEYTIATTDDPQSVFIHSAAAGSYTLNWNLTDKKIAVVYPTSLFITTGQKTEGQADNAGGSFTAVDDSSNDVKGGKFVANNASVTFSATPNTGYTFDGWYTNEACTDGKNTSNPMTVSSINADKTVYAKFVPKTYTVTLSRTGDGYGSGGDASVTATFNVALPSATMPTAAQGYGFMGFYSAEDGGGRQFINASGEWVANAGDTISDSKWIFDNGITLYAYYKEAQITGITFSPGNIVAPSATVSVTATIEPTPVGPTTICWRVLYSNDNPLDPQPTFTPEASGATVSFPAHSASGSYKVEATLRKGTGCGGEEIHTFTAPFQVAGDHTVTVQYKCGDVTLQGAKSISARPLVWSDEITPDEIFGYSFEKWVAGDGVTMTIDGGETTIETGGETTGKATTHAVQIKAIYDGKLIAKYTKKNIIYFKNTLGWSEVYVNLYPYAWWDSSKGAGNNTLTDDKRNKQMTQLGETDIWYYEYGNTATTAYVSFTDRPQDGYVGFAGTSGSDKVKVSYPTKPDATAAEDANYGFNAGTPMFVPTAGQTAQPWNKSGSDDLAEYYNKGYWRKYDPIQGETGYTLKVYDKTGADGRKELKSIKFVESDVPGQLFKAVADLEAAGGYGIKFERNNSMLYTNISGHLHHTGDVVITEKGDDNYAAIWIKATAAGDYTFAITINGDGKLCIQAEFPVAKNDYRVIYTDNDTWTKTHTAHTWVHPSRIISAEENAVDTISFFVSKGHSPEFKIQRVNSINEVTGAITWTDVTSWTSCNDVDASGVYNFIFTQDGSKNISFTKKEPYTGNFYIRTDAAGSTKWDNYRAPDHLMTYSEYSETYSDFTHYFVAHVESTNNVKFVVANDYSPCISDTLEISTYRGGDGDHIETGGYIKANANVRFMWDRRKNAVYRAYLDEAKSDGSKFLVLRANSNTDLMDENGNPLTSGNNHGAPDNSIQFVDNENWIYETNVMVKPGAYVKLYGHFHGKDFYFKGESGDDFDGADGDSDGIANAIQLMTGTGEAQKVRVIYDFKTDRLVAAYLPSGEISTEMDINADVMFIREHQGDIAQLTFSGVGSAITDIKTAYAVMRFNKWTLNNKEKTGSHNPLASPASPYERAMYFISFPFEVKLSEVFGIGNYGQDWIVEYYDGAERARTGWWEGEPGFWRYVWNRKDFVLKPNVGYLLQLELAAFGEESSAWNNNNERLELFFPSSGNLGTITNTTVNCTIPEHACTINRHETEGLPDTGDPRTSYNRTIFDSHWNVMSVPTYVKATPNEWSNNTWTTAIGPKFLYTWNPDDNTLTATSGKDFEYHAMHAYMVQYGGNVQWVTSGTGPASIVARDTYAEQPKEVEFRIEIQQNEKMVDQTFVIMSNDDEINANFQFGEDMSKDFNARNANIYTMTADNVASAGNTLPMSETTTIVPVGVSVKKNGEYTFSIPESTEGIGVTLVDNETGTRTSLSALDYTVTLQPGDYTGRFVLEISPIQNTPTGLEEPTSDSSLKGRAQKVMIDGILYIVKDGKIFDARGARVE